jgi:hypothetical protein
MPRKPTGRPTGRPAKIPDDLAEQLVAGRAAPEDVAARLGVAVSTAYRTRAVGLARRPPTPARQPERARARAPAPSSRARPQARPEPTGAARRAAIVALLDRALAAEPALADAIPLDARALIQRLSAPGVVAEVEEGDLDPLAILRRVQARLERDMAALPPDAVVARRGIAGALVQLAKGAEAIMVDRPPVGETPQEIVGRLIRERADDSRRRILGRIEEAEAEALS